MKKKINLNIFRSTVARIVIVIIALVLPVNVLTLVMSRIINRNNQQQLYREVENSLDMAMGNMEEQLKSAYRRVTLLNSNDMDFRVLEYLSEDEGNLETNSSYSAVVDEMQMVCSESSMVNAVYFLFRSRGRLLVQGNAGMTANLLYSYVKEFCMDADETAVTWEMAEVDENSLLVSHSLWNNADYGVVVNLNFALATLDFDLEEGRTVFFCNEEGTIFTSDGASLLEETGMTLEELRQDKRYEVLESASESYGLVLVEVVEVSLVSDVLPLPFRILEVFAIISTIVVIPVLLWFINRKINRPLRRLTGAMDQIESGNLDFRIRQTDGGGIEFDQINRNFNSMMEEVQELKIDAYEKELERKDIQMKYLSQQIQPHFILNTLNILYSYDEDEYPLMQKLILCLSKYFRYIVRVNSKYVELEKEMEHIRNYFEIQKARFLDAFTFEVEYEEELRNALVPVLLLQNFAENTIKYSLRASEGGCVRVTAEYLEHKEDYDYMVVCVVDNGMGLSDDILEKIERFKETGEPQEGLGVGITNSIERLKYIYSDELTDIRFRRDEAMGGTVVEIILPIITGGQDEDTFGG